jgi:hypothetical protein
MKKLYEIGFYILTGIIAGMFLALKFLAPPGTEIKLGKLVIKGKQNEVTDILDLDIKLPDSKAEKRKIRSYRIQGRKTRRLARKTKRKGRKALRAKINTPRAKN